jgi:hypothetical protein
MNNQLIIFCLPISDQENEDQSQLMEYNSIDQYENFNNVASSSSDPQNVWYGKDNIITNNNIYERKLSNTMIQFSYENTHKQWPTKTAYKCYWCCHSFDTRPYFIPTKYQDSIFHVYGNFCSFNCALAYNNDRQESNWTFNAELLHFLYRKIYGTNDEIKIAPPREVLEDFGGNISIDEFRNNFSNNKEYAVLHPPVISMISQISESIKLKSASTLHEIKCKPIQKQLFKKSKKMVQRKLFS